VGQRADEREGQLGRLVTTLAQDGGAFGAVAQAGEAREDEDAVEDDGESERVAQRQ